MAIGQELKPRAMKTQRTLTRAPLGQPQQPPNAYTGGTANQESFGPQGPSQIQGRTLAGPQAPGGITQQRPTMLPPGGGTLTPPPVQQGGTWQGGGAQPRTREEAQEQKFGSRYTGRGLWQAHGNLAGPVRFSDLPGAGPQMRPELGSYTNASGDAIRLSQLAQKMQIQQQGPAQLAPGADLGPGFGSATRVDADPWARARGPGQRAAAGQTGTTAAGLGDAPPEREGRGTQTAGEVAAPGQAPTDQQSQAQKTAEEGAAELGYGTEVRTSAALENEGYYVDPETGEIYMTAGVDGGPTGDPVGNLNDPNSWNDDVRDIMVEKGFYFDAAGELSDYENIDRSKKWGRPGEAQMYERRPGETESPEQTKGYLPEMPPAPEFDQRAIEEMQGASARRHAFEQSKAMRMQSIMGSRAGISPEQMTGMQADVTQRAGIASADEQARLGLQGAIQQYQGQLQHWQAQIENFRMAAQFAQDDATRADAQQNLMFAMQQKAGIDQRLMEYQQRLNARVTPGQVAGAVGGGAGSLIASIF